MSSGPRPGGMALGPASAAAGGQLLGRLPEPQMVGVQMPKGEAEAMLARLDVLGRCLRLRDLAEDAGGKMVVGSETGLTLERLQAVHVSGSVLRLEAEGGESIVNLHLESEDKVQAWLCGLKEVLRTNRGGTDGDSAGGADAAGGSSRVAGDAESLRAFCQQLEERHRTLEAANAQKEAHLIKLHDRLEQALGVLQEGHSAYAKQQLDLETNEATIAELLALAGKGRAVRTSSVPGVFPKEEAKAVAVGAHGNAPQEELAGLLSQAEALQRQLAELAGAEEVVAATPLQGMRQ